MNLITHQQNNSNIAEIVAEALVITDAESGLDLLGNLYFQGVDRVIIYAKNICPDFFDLKTGIAGEILQKFTNYRVRLAIIGDFSQYESQSLQDFIYESNKGRQVNFVGDVEEGIRRLAI